jgi:hypothetical protein
MTGSSAAAQLRLALQAGLTPEQVALIASGQSLQVAAGAPLAVGGPAVGERERAGHLLLDRVANFLQVAAILEFRTGDGGELVALARLACDVPDEIDDAPVFAAVRRLIDLHDQLAEAMPGDRRRLVPLILAATVARTPDVPLPATQ